MEISRKTVAINDYKEIKAKQDEFHAIEDLFDLYWELQTNLRPALKRLEGEDLELYAHLRHVCFLLSGRGEGAFGLMCDLGEEINLLRREVLGAETDWFEIEED